MLPHEFTPRTLKQFLNSLSRPVLIKEIYLLVRRFSQVKQFYDSHFNSQAVKIDLEKYKDQVKHEFFPKRGFGKARLSIARKPVQEYVKINPNSKELVDLMIFYVEQGSRFTNEYGDIDKPFYNSMKSMFENALKLTVKLKLQDEFRGRCEKIVESVSRIGWGYYDDLKYMVEH